jgi:hypothetical protein
MFKNIIFSISLVLLMSLSLTSNAFVRFVDNGTTVLVGNTTGGTPVVPSPVCPQGTVAIGMEGQEAVAPADPSAIGFLVSYATRCGIPTVDFATGKVDAPYSASSILTKTFFANSPGPLKSLDCPTGTVMVGFSGFQRAHTQYKDPAGAFLKLVDALRPRCASISYDPALNRLVSGTVIDADATLSVIPSLPGVGSEIINNADCPASSLVNGFSGNTGNLFDKFQLSCVKVEQTTLIVSIIDANPSDYEVIAVTAKGDSNTGFHKRPMILEPDTYTLTLVKKSTGEKFSNFVCTPVISPQPDPYVIKLDNEKVDTCTIQPIPDPVTKAEIKIVTVNSVPATDVDYQIVNKLKPTIIGTSSKNIDVTVVDGDKNVICKTKSDATGNWNCVPDMDLTLDKKYDLVASESATVVSNLAKIMISIPIQTALPTPTPAKAVPVTIVPAKTQAAETPRTGGYAIATSTLAILATVTLLTFKKLKRN